MNIVAFPVTPRPLDEAVTVEDVLRLDFVVDPSIRLASVGDRAGRKAIILEIDRLCRAYNVELELGHIDAREATVFVRAGFGTAILRLDDLTGRDIDDHAMLVEDSRFQGAFGYLEARGSHELVERLELWIAGALVKWMNTDETETQAA